MFNDLCGELAMVLKAKIMASNTFMPLQDMRN